MSAPPAAEGGIGAAKAPATNVKGALERLTSSDERGLAEEVLRRFYAIAESTDDAMISKTLDGTITSWNAAAERIFGYRADEVVGASIQIVIPPKCAGEEPLILAHIRDGQRVEQFETVRTRKDGSRLPASLTVAPIWGAESDEQGPRSIVGISKTVRDITQRKAAEATASREQGFASSLIEARPGIFYLYDRAGRFLRWNRNLERVS